MSVNYMEWHDFNFEHMGRMHESSFDKNEIAEFIGVKDGLSVLDLGAGDGFFSKAFADRGAKVTAIDINDRYFKEMNNAGISTKKADICSFNEGAYDIIFMANVLHDLDCKKAVASNIYSMAAKNLAIIEFKEDTPFGPSRDIRLNPEDVRRIFEGVGFRQSKAKELKYHYLIVFEKQ